MEMKKPKRKHRRRKNSVQETFDKAVRFFKEGKQELGNAILEGMCAVYVQYAIEATTAKFIAEGNEHLIPKHLRPKRAPKAKQPEEKKPDGDG